MKNITKFYNYKKLFKIIILITFYNLLPYLTYAQWIKLPNTNLSPNDRINNLIANSNGILYASQNNYVVKWDGNSWSKLGSVNDSFNGDVRTIAQDKDGNIYAGGEFTNTKGQSYIAKYNGTIWSEFGILDGTCQFPNRSIYKIVTDLKDGQIKFNMIYNPASIKQGLLYSDVTNDDTSTNIKSPFKPLIESDLTNSIFSELILLPNSTNIFSEISTAITLSTILEIGIVK